MFPYATFNISSKGLKEASYDSEMAENRLFSLKTNIQKTEFYRGHGTDDRRKKKKRQTRKTVDRKHKRVDNAEISERDRGEAD